MNTGDIRCSGCGSLLGEYHGEEAILSSLIEEWFCQKCNHKLELGLKIKNTKEEKSNETT